MDLHPNVVTYYDKEEDKDFIYLAIEKCEGNLENLVQLMKAVTDSDDKNLWLSLPLGEVFRYSLSDLHDPI